MQVQLLNYTDKCFLSLTQNLLEVVDHCPIVSIHKIRLSIKKLHTLYTFVDFSNKKGTESKTIKLIDRVFVYSGNLRDIQLQISILKSYQGQVGEEVNNFIRQLKKEKKKEERKFKGSIMQLNPFDIVMLNQKIDNIIEASDDTTLESVCKLKAEELFEQIINSKKDIKNENTLHHIRIMLKELIYILGIINRKHRNLKYNKIFISNLDNLQKKIGDWHDLKKLFERLTAIDNFNSSNYLLQIISTDKQSIQEGIIVDLSKLQSF